MGELRMPPGAGGGAYVAAMLVRGLRETDPFYFRRVLEEMYTLILSRYVCLISNAFSPDGSDERSSATVTTSAAGGWWGRVPVRGSRKRQELTLDLPGAGYLTIHTSSLTLDGSLLAVQVSCCDDSCCHS